MKKSDAVLEPLEDRVLVKIAESARQYGRILILESARERPQQGVILAKGPGRGWWKFRSPIPVEVGDTVVFAKFAGVEITVDGQPRLIIREADIIARLVPEAR